LKATATSQPPQ